jgi:DNA-binding NarL/FixJ family response regulator
VTTTDLPIRILLVDDQPSVLRGLRMRLGLERDLEVVGEAYDGSAALDMTASQRPDVILMDIEMPIMDGITATQRIRKNHPRCAVVVLSLHDDEATRRAASEAGAVEFVAKHEIDRALTDAIRHAAQREEPPARP